MDVHTTQPTGGRSPRRRRARLAFLVALGSTMPLLAPPHAVEADTMFNLGGGVVAGTANFTTGIPALDQGCADTTFTLDATTATAVVMNTVITGFVGDFNVVGDGNSTVCETLTNGVGEIRLTVPTSTGPTGSEITCNLLEGTYTRVGAIVAIVARGNCTVNQFGTGVVEFISTVEVTATNPGAGQTNPVMTVDFNGNFTLAPVEAEDD